MDKTLLVQVLGSRLLKVPASLLMFAMLAEIVETKESKPHIPHADEIVLVPRGIGHEAIHAVATASTTSYQLNNWIRRL